MQRMMIALALASGLTASPAVAQLQEVRQIIFGMDWAVCAHAVRVAVQKLEGVRSVTVSLNDGYADVVLASPNTVTVERIREAIRRNGFTPREAQVRVRGFVVRQGEQLVLQVPGSEVAFLLAGSGEALERLARAASGSPVSLDGTVPDSPRGSKMPLLLRVADGPGRESPEGRS